MTLDFLKSVVSAAVVKTTTKKPTTKKPTTKKPTTKKPTTKKPTTKPTTKKPTTKPTTTTTTIDPDPFRYSDTSKTVIIGLVGGNPPAGTPFPPIPSTVIRIGENAFYNYTEFTGPLTIPDSVIHIERGAFYNCSGFTGSFTIPSSVTTIGLHAFNGCSGFTGSLTINGNVTSIESFAFTNCFGFNGSLTLPPSLVHISLFAFENCRGFTGSLNIPPSVTSIGINAFRHCIGFTAITYNQGTSIGDGAFFDCVKPTILSTTTTAGPITTTTKSPYISASFFTGTKKEYGGVTVPTDAKYVRVVVGGNSGGNSGVNFMRGGLGGLVCGTFPVTPGQSVGYFIGGPAPTGTPVGYGAGGGGCSAVVDNSLNIMLIAGGGGGASSAANGGNSDANLSNYLVRGGDINVINYVIEPSNGDAINAGTGGTINIMGGGLLPAYGVLPDAFQKLYQRGGWGGGGAGKGICGGGGGNLGQGGGAYNTRGSGNSGDGGYNFANNRVTITKKGIHDNLLSISNVFPGAPPNIASIIDIPYIYLYKGEAFVALAFLSDLV